MITLFESLVLKKGKDLTLKGLLIAITILAFEINTNMQKMREGQDVLIEKQEMLMLKHTALNQKVTDIDRRVFDLEGK